MAGYGQHRRKDYTGQQFGFLTALMDAGTTQARNTRANRMIDTPRGKMLLVEAAECSGVGLTTLSYRINVGWPVERLFDTPSPKNRPMIS